MTFRRGDLVGEAVDGVVHFQFQGEKAPATLADAELRGALTRVLATDGFEGKPDSILLWHGDGRRPSTRTLVVGLGRREDFGRASLHRAAAAAGARAAALKIRRLGAVLSPPAWRLKPEEAARIVAGGLLFGGYRFDKYQRESRGAWAPEALVFGSRRGEPRSMRKALDEARVVDDVLRLARDLVSEHPGYLHPTRMGAIAREESKKAGIACRILEEKEMRKLGMGGMLGVSRGSEHPAVFIHLHYSPRGARRGPRVVLIGKGVTFDTGGISLKQADGMEAMKADMSGAAAVLATLLALPALKLPVEVHGLLLMVENMPDGRAIRPGDVLRMFNGKTVEIKSTDAEGRLILADGLSWAVKNLRPGRLIDLATLTGACMVALGPDCTGVMGNDERLTRDLLRAAEAAGEKMWPLPLYPEYREHIRSEVADVRNSGIRYGGAITAGLFLQEFVDPEIPWAHLDIAGPAYFESGYAYAPRGATGHGVRTLLQYLRSLA